MIGTGPVLKSVSKMSYVMFLALLNFEIIPPSAIPADSAWIHVFPGAGKLKNS